MLVGNVYGYCIFKLQNNTSLFHISIIQNMYIFRCGKNCTTLQFPPPPQSFNIMPDMLLGIPNCFAISLFLALFLAYLTILNFSSEFTILTFSSALKHFISADIASVQKLSKLTHNKFTGKAKVNTISIKMHC